MSAATDHSEIVIAGLLFAIAALVTAARVLNVPYPVFLVLGGLGIGLVPGARSRCWRSASCWPPVSRSRWSRTR